MKNYIRNILIFIITFSLVFGLCVIPSFADSYTFENLFTVHQIASNTQNGRLNYGWGTCDPTYGFFYKNNSNGYYFTAVCSNDGQSYTISLGDSQGNSYITRNISNTDSITGLYYYDFNNINFDNSNKPFYCPEFNNINDGLAAVKLYIDNNPPITETTYNAYFDIPCGNVAYIRTGDDNTLTLSCTMPEFSSLTGSTGNYWDNTMQIAYSVPSYPPSGTTFPLSNMSEIQWFKSTEGRDLFGRTKKALFLDTTQSGDNFIVIYNPTYRKLSTSGQGNVNPTIRVQCSALIDYHMYALSGEFNSQGTVSSYSTDNFVNPYIGIPTYDGEDVQGTNSNGATPNVGGTGNEIGGYGGIIEYIQGINKTLDTFANSFISLLKSPISHIQSLIAAGTDYFNMIKGLYGWLPDDVQGTINSAMIVSISVGVIALLL